MERERNLNSNKIAVIVIAVVLAVAVFSVVSNVVYQKTGFRGTYNRAVVLAVQGDVKEAEKLFTSIEQRDYKDTDAFLLYCRAIMKAEKGEYDFGYWNRDRFIFENLTDEQSALIEERIGKIVKAYEREQEEKYSSVAGETTTVVVEAPETVETKEESVEKKTTGPGASAISQKYGSNNQGKYSDTGAVQQKNQQNRIRTM